MTEPLRTLVVDDEEGIRFFLSETLQRAGYLVNTATSGEEALDQLREEQFDVILLDLKLGGRVDGIHVLELIRWRWPNSIVIILTAHGSLSSALDAIREGVDGYLLKPVEPEQVRLAIQDALERRKKLVQGQEEEGRQRVLEDGPFHVDLEKHVALFNGEPLDLTPREFTLLAHLIQNKPQVLSPSDLVRIVRQYDPEHVYEAREIIKWYIHRLRQKVEPDPSNPQYIVNVRGVGYRFESHEP
jgi:DNA-binding response OmpR family regulator